MYICDHRCTSISLGEKDLSICVQQEHSVDPTWDEETHPGVSGLKRPPCVCRSRQTWFSRPSRPKLSPKSGPPLSCHSETKPGKLSAGDLGVSPQQKMPVPLQNPNSLNVLRADGDSNIAQLPRVPLLWLATEQGEQEAPTGSGKSLRTDRTLASTLATSSLLCLLPRAELVGGVGCQRPQCVTLETGKKRLRDGATRPGTQR